MNEWRCFSSAKLQGGGGFLVERSEDLKPFQEVSRQDLKQDLKHLAQDKARRVGTRLELAD